ncbi:MAG: hypothetical protein JSW60_06360, partial [Thermoplasmatales archaeon]
MKDNIVQKNYAKKIIVFSIISILIMVASAPVFNSAIVKTTSDKNETFNDLAAFSTDNGWYWKDPYPNYAPSGMPDFSQKQKQWKSIVDGGNGTADTNATGDDIQLILMGGEVNPGDIIIAPGQNCQLDTIASGDDVAKWAFCGPVALANCFWWFDSKYAIPDGTPGDGEDEFTLVENYGVQDDHSQDNVPLLIEELARAMNTSGKGKTSINDMADAIDQWLVDTNLQDNFEKTIKDEPTFEFIAGEINRSQDVILLLGFYDYIIGEKIIDQSQPFLPFYKFLQNSTLWDYQSFIPNIKRLDAIKIPLHSVSTLTCEVEINVYESEEEDPVGTATLNPGYLSTPTWIQFHFEPHVELTPQNTYYFDVLQKEAGYHYEWYYESPDPYDGGTGWMNKVPQDPLGYPFDWAFVTEFYDPPPGSVRREAHYVTCAGVDSENTSIAFSDPRYDIFNPSENNHNDAQNVSHDLYVVDNSSPCPDLNYTCWLPNYPTDHDYTLVEQAVIICPIPDE